MIKENYNHLDFPFNILAHALYLQEGRVDSLHYGLFETEQAIESISVQAVQQRVIDLLFNYLPEAHCRILEVGRDLGTSALLLNEHGYSVTCISPDAQQIEIAQQRTNKNIIFKCINYEDFSVADESYDVILFQESAQYIQSLTLFNKAYNLLSKQGVILIIDEFGLQRTEKYNTYNLPVLKYTIDQASRCGFELKEQLDLSAQAAPTVDFLIWLIEKHKTALIADLALESNTLIELLDALREYQQKYRDGHYGYAFLKFAKVQTPPRWKITTVSTQDKKAVRTLFNEVFPPPPMSDAMWEWKYGENQGLGTAAWLGDKMVAHYGGLKRCIHYFGQPKLAVQIGDVMVSTKERSRLRRHGRGVFSLTAATFPECYVGYGALIELGYGFPDRRHMKIAEISGLYAPVGKMIELRWQATLEKPHLWTRIRHLQAEQLDKNTKIINKLWQQMAGCLNDSLVGVRNWKYVQHRYFSHPHKSYELLLISRRFTGQALAVAVIYHEGDLYRVMDFIGHIKYMPETIKQVRRVAGLRNMKQVSVWITENFMSVFALQGSEQHDLNIQIPHSIWSQGVPPEKIKDHWWLMAGDTDFM